VISRWSGLILPNAFETRRRIGWTFIQASFRIASLEDLLAILMPRATLRGEALQSAIKVCEFFLRVGTADLVYRFVGPTITDLAQPKFSAGDMWRHAVCSALAGPPRGARYGDSARYAFWL